jgi:hypothetical protein
MKALTCPYKPYVCIYECMHICRLVCMFVCMYVCMYVCVYAFQSEYLQKRRLGTYLSNSDFCSTVYASNVCMYVCTYVIDELLPAWPDLKIWALALNSPISFSCSCSGFTSWIQGCHIFLCAIYQSGENVPNYYESIANGNKIYPKTIKCTKILHSEAFQVHKNLDFSYENKPSGNPGWISNDWSETLWEKHGHCFAMNVPMYIKAVVDQWENVDLKIVRLKNIF